jgi:PAS domain S-box-containing protein
MSANTRSADLATNAKLAQMLAKAASVMIWISDTEKACVYFNDTWLNYRGRTLEEEYGFGWAEGVHPEDYERCIKVFTDAFDKRLSFQMDYRLMTAEGIYRWIRDEGEPYWNEQGEFDGYIGSCYDIDELRRTQEASKTATWSFDLTTNTVWWSSELFHAFGLPISDAAPPFETHKDLFSSESWSLLKPAVTAAFEHGIPYELELELNHASGERRVAIATCEPQKGKNGRVQRLVGTFRDITTLVKARSEAVVATHRLKLAKNAAGIGVWEWDFSSNELVWDDRMFEIYGFEPGPIQYDEWRAALHPEDVVNAEPKLDQAKTGDDEFNTTFRIHRNGEIRHILALSTVRDQRFVGVNLDVTEQVRMSEEMRRINDLEALGALAGGIAHDFNNQLTNIRARIDLMALRADDTQYIQQTAAQLGLAIDAASGLTKQLLTFAKNGSLARESASMEDLVRETIDFCLHGVPVQVVYEIEQCLSAANIDRQRIGQVVQNIVINAVQAMDERGGRLTVSLASRHVAHTTPVLKAGDYLELTIADNGPGMSDSVRERIFEPYFTTKRHGHGLGLAICYSVIRQHGGAITVSSSKGQGTAFTMQLPATRERIMPKQEDVALQYGQERVMIVDDMPDVLQSMVDLAQAIGYDCVPATSPTMAEELFLKTRDQGGAIKVVLTDLTMPGTGGGVEVLEKLKAIDPSVRVILISGYVDTPLAESTTNVGFDGRLDKPCSLKDLSAQLAGE